MREGDGDLLAVFASCRSGGFGPGPMPFSGGYAEQPAGLMDLFRHLEAIAQAVDKESQKT